MCPPNDLNIYRLIQWLNSCNRTDLLERETNIRTNNKNLRVCNCHFETNMFFTTQRKRLRTNAEPTLFGVWYIHY